MNLRWKRLSAVARKETIQIIRDFRSLLVVIVMPIMLMALLGYGVSLDLKHVPLCVLDREGSQKSQDLLRRFTQTQYFDLREATPTYRQLVSRIDDGTCQLGLVIPHDFSERIRRGETVGVQGIVDATDNNTASLVFGYAEIVVNGFSRQVQLDWAHERGQTYFVPPISLDARTWFNEDLESRAFIVPGVVAIVMSVIGTLLTSLTIAREWERGTMEQLVSTPVTGLELMVGKLAPYFVIGMFDTALCAGITIWWFEVPFRGSLVTLFGASGLFLITVLAIGFWISAITRNQLAASQFSLLATFLPAFLLSGFAFPIDQMPAPIRAFTYMISARYYVTILKSVFLKGVGFSALIWPLCGLAVFATIISSLALRSMRKTLE
jgi:ABC-2 type transport system permease protein